MKARVSTVTANDRRALDALSGRGQHMAADVAKRCKVSESRARERMRRLEDMGLVDIMYQHGFAWYSLTAGGKRARATRR